MKIIFLFLLPAFLYAKEETWQKITIPGAFCADGSEYNVFYRDKNSSNLSIKINGGNACWDFRTCYEDALTNLTSVDNANPRDFLINKESPLYNSDALLLTYCTGDVHLGKHTAHYGGIKTRHHGHRNIRLAIRYFLIHYPKSYDQLNFYGVSAGAIGAIHHAPFIDQQFQNIPNKNLLLEAPGLHFGNLFWNKFGEAYIHDFIDSFAQYDRPLDTNNGNASIIIKDLCRKLHDWNVGIVQASRDWVMSFAFGNIDPFRHKNLVLGKKGLWSHTKEKGDNCSAFIPDTFKHTLLKDRDNWTSIRANNSNGQSKDLITYVKNIIAGKRSPSYK